MGELKDAVDTSFVVDCNTPQFQATPSLQRAPRPTIGLTTSSIPDDFLPQELPRSPSNGLQASQRPGAYRWDQQTTTLERNSSLVFPSPPDLEAQHTVEIGGQQPPSAFLVEATLVQDSEVCDNDNSPNSSQTLVAAKAEELHCGFAKRQLLFVGACLCLVLLVTAVVALVATTQDSSAPSTTTTEIPSLSPTSNPLPTLEQIKERGVLRCGIWDESHKMIQMAKVLEKEEDQLDIALCRAIAAAVLGNASNYELVDAPQGKNFQLLANGTIDLLASHVETSMQADVYEDERGIDVGITFSVPYLYSDMVFGGVPEYVTCVDEGDKVNINGNCSDLTVCLNEDSEYFDMLREVIPEKHLLLKRDMMAILGGFLEKECNVIPSENTGVVELFLERTFPNLTPGFERGKRPFTQDVATVATRDDDPEWSDFVNAILIGLFAAERANITQPNASLMLNAAVLGQELKQVVEAVGNYGDLFSRGVETILHRGNWNLLNDGSTGLLYTLPFGKVYKGGPAPLPDGTLATIASRTLNCGVRLGRFGFATYDTDSNSFEGLDVDYCRAIAAAIFHGDTGKMNIVAIDKGRDGYGMLESGEVDVLAGFTWTIQNDFHEETTGKGYSFSQPYFYKPIEAQNNNYSLEFDENLCIVSRQNDPQFSSFVNWIVSATFYAEFSIEHRHINEPITRETARNMPDIHLFGDSYLKMLRNAILVVGNYNEMYDRNVAATLPRGGRNVVNSVAQRGPQIYIPPGFFNGT